MINQMIKQKCNQSMDEEKETFVVSPINRNDGKQLCQSKMNNKEKFDKQSFETINDRMVPRTSNQSMDETIEIVIVPKTIRNDDQQSRIQNGFDDACIKESNQKKSMSVLEKLLIAFMIACIGTVCISKCYSSQTMDQTNERNLRSGVDLGCCITCCTSHYSHDCCKAVTCNCCGECGGLECNGPKCGQCKCPFGHAAGQPPNSQFEALLDANKNGAWMIEYGPWINCNLIPDGDHATFKSGKENKFALFKCTDGLYFKLFIDGCKQFDQHNSEFEMKINQWMETDKAWMERTYGCSQGNDLPMKQLKDKWEGSVEIRKLSLKLITTPITSAVDSRWKITIKQKQCYNPFGKWSSKTRNGEWQCTIIGQHPGEDTEKRLVKFACTMAKQTQNVDIYFKKVKDSYPSKCWRWKPLEVNFSDESGQSGDLKMQLAGFNASTEPDWKDTSMKIEKL